MSMIAALLLLASGQDAALLTPAEIVLPADRDARIAGIERWMELSRFTPTTRRIIASMMADESFAAERQRAQRDRLTTAVESAMGREPFDLEAAAAALGALDAFDRAHPDGKPAMTIRLLRALPASERGTVARHLIGRTGAGGESVMTARAGVTPGGGDANRREPRGPVAQRAAICFMHAP